MSGILSYLKYCHKSYKTYKQWKGSGLNLYRGFIPSETYIKYPPNCFFNEKRVLNLGCGRNVYRAPNVTNLDCVAADGVNVVWDLAKTPLPFATGEFDFIIANHVLEHIPNWFECFKELARVLKSGGTLEVWIPPVSSDSAFTYRDHINRIGVESFAGTADLRRNGTNLAAGVEFAGLTDVARLRMVKKMARPALHWWCFFAPSSVLNWMSTHLRNVISEEGYFFIKEGK